MGSINWGFVALGGILLVFVGNVLRFRRTGDSGCLGHFFVPSRDLATGEMLLNRLGIAVFAAGIVLALLT